MIQKIGQSVTAYAFYAASKVGKTGLTVTVKVRGHDETLLVNGSAATEVGEGWYKYVLAGASTGNAGNYKFTFSTADTTVDQRDIPALWVIGPTWVEFLDSALSGIPAAVWAYGTRTLSGFGTLAADMAMAVWGAATRTLTTFSFTPDANLVTWRGSQPSTLVGGKPQVDVAAYETGMSPTDALATYDPPTRAEATADKADVLTAVGAPLQASGYTAPPSAVAVAAAVGTQITTDHGSGSYQRNTEPDNTGIAAGTLAAQQANTKAAAIQTVLSGITSLAAWLRAGLRKSAPDAAAASEIGGTYDATTDSQEALRDRGDAAWGAGAIPSAASIADAVWEEPLSDHRGAGSAGAALDSAGSGGVTLYGGDGAIEWSYTVYDTDGTTPLPGVEVWVSGELAGTQRSASKFADALGRVTFRLHPGPVYVWRRRHDRTFANPDPETVS